LASTLETRRPRASFTRVLERLCARLDECATFSLKIAKRDFFPAYEATVKITSLSVVGSYARGAPECGDLDVLLALEVLDGREPPLTKLTRAAFGSTPDVRFYAGTPARNSSNIPFGDCVAIWGQGASWRAALAAIPDDRGARAHREGDAVPLRIEQVDADLTERRRLTELEREGILRWRLLPYDGGEAPENLNELQRHVAHLATCGWGLKSQALLPDLLRYFGTRHDCFERQSSNTRLDMAGIRAQLGRCTPEESLLDEVHYAKILIAPHLSRRGPNAFWEIERGARHPLELAFADRGAYVLGDLAGVPDIGREIGEERWREAAFIELFASAKAALAWDAYLNSNNNSDEPLIEKHPVLLRGRALLDLLSYADIVDVIEDSEHSVTHFLTRKGLEVRGTLDSLDEPVHRATLDELLASFPVAPSM